MMHNLLSFGGCFLFLAAAGQIVRAEPPEGPAEGSSPVLKSEFIYESAPFPSCHASTIAQSGDCLVAAWFGGSREGQKDVEIWLSRCENGAWSAPRMVADGVAGPGERYPCWNPVLFQMPDGPLMLFYKVGPSPSRWWGMLKTSDDGGRTFGEAVRLPEGILGPVKNKPVLLADGTLLCGSSGEATGWLVHVERTADGGKTWEKIGPIHDGSRFSAIQPTILTYADGRIELLCRTRQKSICRFASTDGGKSWADPEDTGLPNPNSGIDGVTLRDGRQLMVYNHTPLGRSPLNVAVSRDGRDWKPVLVLENTLGEFSYPAVIQTPDGLVHVTYTWKRQKVRHVVIDPEKLAE